MASWTLKQTIGTVFVGSGVSIDATDTDVYIYNDIKNVYQYHPGTDTLTLIGDSSSFDGGFGFASGYHNQLVIFNGDLYVGAIRFLFSGGAHYYAQIYKYDGTPLSWTKVHDVEVVGGVDFVLLTDESELVWACSNGADYYSTNGVSWVAGSLGARSVELSSRNGNQKGLFGGFDGNLYLYVGSGVWSLVESSTYYRTSGPDNHWRFNASNIWQYASSFPASWTTPSNTDPEAGYQVNMGADIGSYINAGSFTLYLFETTDWDAGEVIDTGYSSGAIYMARLGLGEGVAIIYDGDVNIYLRDSNYPAPTPPVVSGNRLWLYKSADNGVTWENRGVKT